MSERIFAGGICTETNVFSPMVTGLGDFTVVQATEAPEIRDSALSGWAFRSFVDEVSARGGDLIQGMYAAAQPAGPTTRAAYETLRDLLLDEIENALPLDGILLGLHGAMVAAGYEDCETDLVRELRVRVGDRIKIGVLLDLHCDIPQELLDLTDLIVVYKEYPHTDIGARAAELANLLLDAIRSQIDPVMAIEDCGMFGLYPTMTQPMRGFVDAMSALERAPEVLSVSLGHGFPWGDAPAIGARALVISNGDLELASRLAADLAKDFFRIRHEVTLAPLRLEEALSQAISMSLEGGPIVVADVADNAGGGAPSDSTFALEYLLNSNATGAAVGVLWDPAVVHLAFAAGEGSRIAVRLGGKTGPFSGDPLDLTVEVRSLVPKLVQRWPQMKGSVDVPSGDCAHLACEGLDIIVGAVRQQVVGVEMLTAFGIAPADCRVIVLKSANHFRAAFEPLARAILYMSSPAALSFDFETLPYKRFDSRRYPLSILP